MLIAAYIVHLAHGHRLMEQPPGQLPARGQWFLFPSLLPAFPLCFLQVDGKALGTCRTGSKGVHWWFPPRLRLCFPLSHPTGVTKEIT